MIGFCCCRFLDPGLPAYHAWVTSSCVLARTCKVYHRFVCCLSPQYMASVQSLTYDHGSAED